ncbi:MAG: Fic family protein [Actinomycetaceae bacterium]|nr:Fic family protein [Actinomycetaceae bacterium]
MGQYKEHLWEGNESAPLKRDRRSGQYRSFTPGTLTDLALPIPTPLALRAAKLENRIQAFPTYPEAAGVESLSRLLVRSEAMASSYIEGLQVSARKVAEAELQRESQAVEKLSHTAAQQVAANIAIIDQAMGQLATGEEITVADIEALQYRLLAAEGADPKNLGLRKFQNWVGGSGYHPLEAEFIPPPPQEVPRLVQDLAHYASGATHGTLIQSALVHAQFETIHPFSDGNGRVGRALIHTIWRRRGLESAAVIPVSAALATRSKQYVAGLTALRTTAEPSSPEWNEDVARWLEVFFDATETALMIAQRFAEDIADLKENWRVRHEEYGQKLSARALRADSTAVRLRDALPAMPMFTSSLAQERLAVSSAAARNACGTLQEAGIITQVSIGRGVRGWYAPEIFEVLNIYERQLASTQWDTRAATPSRPTPNRIGGH